VSLSRERRDEVRVWACRTDRAPSLDACRALLPPEEVERAERGRREADRAEAIVVAAFRRAVLARETGEPPRALRFRTDCRWCGDPGHGKPALAGREGEGISFSLSHTAGLALLAVAAREVGADVERRVDWDVRPAARLALSGAESARVADAPEGGVADFLDLWTRKEAYLKGIGLGLVHDPSRVSFGDDRGPWSPVVDDGAATAWRVRGLPFGGPWIAALAVEGAPPRAVRIAAAPPLGGIAVSRPHRPSRPA
jgi:4'-phosphopantetheinyl transferase